MAPSNRSLSVLLTTILFLVTRALAQQSANLTLTFSPGSARDPCATRDAAESISFTTSFLSDPGIGACITLSDVYTGNASYRNTSYSLGDERVNITFTLNGQANYDPGANYSNVLYSQPYPGDGEAEAADEDYYALRNVNFYHGEDCEQGVTDEAVVPWYLSNCRARDHCQHLPLAVGSFYVYRPEEEDSDGDREKKGRCVLAAQYGAGSVARPVSGWSVIGMAAVGIALLV